MPAQVANQSKGFGSFCPLKRAINHIHVIKIIKAACCFADWAHISESKVDILLHLLHSQTNWILSGLCVTLTCKANVMMRTVNSNTSLHVSFLKKKCCRIWPHTTQTSLWIVKTQRNCTSMWNLLRRLLQSNIKARCHGMNFVYYWLMKLESIGKEVDLLIFLFNLEPGSCHRQKRNMLDTWRKTVQMT